MYLWKGLLPVPFPQEAFLSPFCQWSWDTKSQIQFPSKASSRTETNHHIYSEGPWQAHDKSMAQHRAEPEGYGTALITSAPRVKLLRSATTFSLLSSTFSLFRGHLAFFICSHWSTSLFFIPTKVHTLQRKKHHFNSATIAFSLLMENRTKEQGRSSW